MQLYGKARKRVGAQDWRNKGMDVLFSLFGWFFGIIMFLFIVLSFFPIILLSLLPAYLLYIFFTSLG